MVKIKFIELIDELKRLYGEKEAKINFSSDGITVGVSDKIEDWLNQQKIDPDDVKEELNYKISVLSSTVFDLLNDKEPKRILKKEFVNESYPDIIKHIKTKFIDDKLNKKFLFERTVKNLVIEDLNWEVLTKRYDSDVKEKIKTLKTALLKFLLDDKTNISPLKESSQNFIVEVNEQDIDLLIEELQKIKRQLKDE